MNEIKAAGQFANEINRELEEIRAVAADSQGGLRTLRDLEMGWVAGGSDDQPVW